MSTMPKKKAANKRATNAKQKAARKKAVAPSATRTEKDSLGTKKIPANVYYGIQTLRAVENYPISGMRAHPTLIRAFGMVKQAAAEANKDLGLLDEKRANAIIQAAKDVQQGRWNNE